jgi:hypothetical protein
VDPITAAVVITGLTTVGKPSAEAIVSLVGRLAGPSFDAMGEGVAAPLKAWAKRRDERIGATVIKAGEMLQAANIEPQANATCRWLSVAESVKCSTRSLPSAMTTASWYAPFDTSRDSYRRNCCSRRNSTHAGSPSGVSGSALADATSPVEARRW